jgi:hypothetical protein
VLHSNSNVEGPLQALHIRQPTFATIWQADVLNYLPSNGISSTQAYQLLSNRRWFLYTAINHTDVPDPSVTILGQKLQEWMTALAHSLTLQQAWDSSGSSARQYTWVFLSMLQNLMGIFCLLGQLHSSLQTPRSHHVFAGSAH